MSAPECTWIDKLRGPKILDMSIFDWIASLLGAVILGHMLNLETPLNWVLFLIAWTAFGVLIHYAFGVSTMLGYYLGLNPKPERKKRC
jgi:hypothetical protein